MSDLLNDFSVILFPKRCKICAEVIEFDKKYCDDCLKLKRISGELCSSCGSKKNRCFCVDNKKPEYKQIIAPFYFNDTIVEAIHKFKFNSFSELSKSFSEEMIKSINVYYKDIDFDFITFVPMRKKALRKRGYNQSELLANDISKRLNIPVKDVLTKVRDTNNQHDISERERRNNLRGAFDLKDGEDVANKTILLIDDVKTTGSTLNECSAVLNAYGAKEIYCATFAITYYKSANKKHFSLN